MSLAEESLFEELGSTFELESDDEQEVSKKGGHKLTRKKSGTAVREKPGLKKKTSMRKLRERRAQSQKNKSMLEQIDWTGQLGKLMKQQRRQQASTNSPNSTVHDSRRIRVVSAKIETDPGKKFEGKWESEAVPAFDGFLTEMNLGAGFKKLAAKFGGTQVQKLYIKQDGEYFEIVETNDRRDVYIAMQMNETFSSVSERGDAMECIANWEDTSKKDEIIIEAKNLETDEVTITRRRISEDGLTLYESTENGSGKELTSRKYHRK